MMVVRIVQLLLLLLLLLQVVVVVFQPFLRPAMGPVDVAVVLLVEPLPG